MIRAIVCAAALSAATLWPVAASACGPEALGTARTLTLKREGAAYGTAQHGPLPLAKGEVVLTFDDGPRAQSTPLVLKALSDQCAKATFFLVGDAVTQAPDLARRIVAEGHSTGLHSLSHLSMSELPEEAQRADLMAAQAAYRAALRGDAPAYRFPFLAESPALMARLKSENITVMSVDLNIEDWVADQTPDMLTQRLLERLKVTGGGIILMHDAQDQTALALPQMLKALKDNGYRVVHLEWEK